MMVMILLGADLQKEINNAPAGSVLKLTRNYEGAEDTVIELNKDLTIDGNGHTIDCKSLENCEAFTSTSGKITLKNLKIINGCNDGLSPFGDYRGGAIIIKDSAQYTIENCYFENNYADDYGGAIYSADSSKLKIIGCTFNHNKADDFSGGAIYSNSGYELEILNSKFTGNNAYDNGGAICAINSLLKIKNSTFDSNRAEGSANPCYGGAIKGKNVEVHSCDFNNNFAENHGGAIYADSVTIDNAVPSSFASNTAKKG